MTTESLAPGSWLGPYQVISAIGAGGMGEVYRARDPRLGREVAIKTLPKRFTADENFLRRFERENRAVAALSHPNIVAIYDVGSAEGVPYCVMELLEGETLRVRMAHSALPWIKAIEIAAEVADALALAHARGIIHRDLKPENIFLTTAGRTKVFDFGLARWTGRRADPGASAVATAAPPTDPGTFLGTVGYMSPEQIRGEPAEIPSDIFSLGCVLYETLSGRRPFSGATPAETMVAILKDDPPGLLESGIDLPWELARVVGHCLQKEPTDRFQSARDLVFDLRAAATGGVASRASSGRHRGPIDALAVLPLVNAANNPDAEYLSDGITETIINALSRVGGLRVVARSTVFRYKGTGVDPLDAGRELKVRAVVTGRVAVYGETLIVQAELIDLFDGAQLWGERFSRPLSDLLSVENDIAKQISENLRLRLSGEPEKGVTRRATENAEAYQAYLKGRFFWNKRTPQALKTGIEFFNSAIDADPGFALAYVGLADCYEALAFYNAVAPREAFPRAKAAAKKALEIDGSLAEPRASLAYARHYFDWDWPGAEEDYLDALERNPAYSTTRLFYANFLTTMGRFEESHEQLDRAREIDPLSLIINNGTGWTYLYAHRFEDAIAAFRKVAELDRGFIPMHFFLGCALEAAGRMDDAAAELGEAVRLSGGGTLYRAVLARIHARAGRRAQVLEELEGLRSLPADTYVSAYAVATVHAASGNRDAAFEELEKAWKERSHWMCFLRVDPAVQALREDPRFDELSARMNFPA